MSDETMVVNISEALNRAMGDVEFLKTMLDELHRTIPKFATRIQDDLKADDMASLGQSAHQFKGAAASLGAKHLADAAFELEKIGKSGQSDNAAEAFDRLECAIADFNQFFERMDWEALSGK